MPYSELVEVVDLTTNHSGERKNKVTRITPHCYVGQVSVENGLKYFKKKSVKASCNYLIGTDGRIGCSVEEENRSWCSANADNDNRAITIECASDNKHPYAFNDAVYQSLIELCVDICVTYQRTKLIWISDKDEALTYEPASDEMLLTVHCWFANKECPGEWLMSRMDELARTVTEYLTSVNDNSITLYRVQVGAFAQKRNALGFAKGLTDKGYSVYTYFEEGLYKVQTGAFSVKENAERLKERLINDGYDAWVTV